MVRYHGAPSYGPAPHQGEHHEQQPRRLLGRGLLACLLGCTQPVLAQSDAGKTALSCPDQRDGVALAGWVIVEGDPRGDVILAPSDSREERRVAVNVWDLTEYRGSRLSLRCAYGPNRGPGPRGFPAIIAQAVRGEGRDGSCWSRGDPDGGAVPVR